MSDRLKQLGKGLGENSQSIEFLNRRGGLLPQVERTRGNMHIDASFMGHFKIISPVRTTVLKISFYKASLE